MCSYEPSLLLWVHCAEIDSYADVAHRAGIIDDDETEQYLAESVRAARIMGLERAPASRAQMRAYMARMRPTLALTDEARLAVGNMFAPRGRAPTTTRLAIPAIASLAMATLHRWARRMYGLPGLPTTDLTATAAPARPTDRHRHAARLPGPPAIERARQLVRHRNEVRPHVVRGG